MNFKTCCVTFWGGSRSFPCWYLNRYFIMHLPLSLLQFQLIFNVFVFFHFICVVLLMLLVLSASAFSLCWLITLTWTWLFQKSQKLHPRIVENLAPERESKMFRWDREMRWWDCQEATSSQGVICSCFLVVTSVHLFFCFFPFCLPYVADSRPFCLLKHTLTRPLEGWLFVRAQG